MTLSAFGAQIVYDGTTGGAGQEIFVALGGVIVNLCCALPLLLWCRSRQEWLFFGVASLVLAVLNLLPVRSLDGGRVLEQILLCYIDPQRAYVYMKRVSLLFLALLFALSLAVLVGSSFNFSLLLFTLYLSLSVFR